MARAVPALSVACLLLCGCVVERYGPSLPVRPPVPLQESVEARLDYASIGSATLAATWEDGEAEVYDGRLAVRVPGDDGRPLGAPAPQDAAAGPPPGEVQVRFEYWRSKSAGPGPAPLVLVTPILGGGKRLARTHCRDFVRSGFHVLLAWRGAKVLRGSWSLETIPRFLTRAMAARRALVDWAARRPEVDPERIAAFGISMGGILTSVLVAVEPRIHSAVIALAGGDLPRVLTVSDEGRLVRFRERKQHELGLDPKGYEAALRRVLWTDPLQLAPSVDPRRVLLVTTRYDSVVPPDCQQRLWVALGRPLRYDLPTGHYGGIVYLPYVTEIVVDWLRERFATGG